MPEPWDRPGGGPWRTGDLDPENLYLAVGHALSKWERMESEMVHLFAAITGVADKQHFDEKAIRDFGRVLNTTPRTERIAKEADALFNKARLTVPAEAKQIAALEGELEKVLIEYRGWASRRADIAHGYVHERTAPDPTQEGEPTVTSYSLYPSDGSSAKWCNVTGQHAYSFKADEVEKFGDGFEKFEDKVRTFAERLDAWRKKTTTYH